MAPIVAFLVKTVVKAAASYYAGKAIREFNRADKAKCLNDEVNHHCEGIDCSIKQKHLTAFLKNFD